MLCQLGPRGASSDAGAQRTTRDKYDASVGCSAAKGPGRLRDDRLFSSDDITILVHGKWGFATTGKLRDGMRGRKFASNGMRQGATKHRTGVLDLLKGSSVHGGVRSFARGFRTTTRLSGLELADRGDFSLYLKFDPTRGHLGLFCPVQAQTRPDQGRWSAREARNPSNQRAGLDL